MQRRKIVVNEWGDMDQGQHLAMHEAHQEKLEAILEYVREIPQMKSDISELKDDVRSLKFDINLIKIDVKDMNWRLSRFEEASK